MHPTAFRGTRSRGRAPSRVLIGRQLGPPLAEWLECVPKLSLRGSFVERRVDVGNNQDLDRCGEALELARLVLHGIRQRELDRVEELHDSLSHRDDELWLHDVQLTREERARLVLVDRLLEVLLVDLVGRWHGPLDFRGYRTRSLAWAIHLRDWRYTSDLGRRRIWAERRLSRNSSGPWNARILTPPVPTPWRTWASEPAPIVRLYLRAKRRASSL